jgi:hypothetical protein
MSALVAAVLIGLAFVTFAGPAAAYVVAVPASVPAHTLGDDDDSRAALSPVTASRSCS